MTNVIQVCTKCALWTYEREGNSKYLRKNCYYRIKCVAATFLAAFMWRRPLNCAALATTTYRRLKEVSDETGTQVGTQMINKCGIKMIQEQLYNVKDPSWEGDRKEREKRGSNLNHSDWTLYSDLTSSDWKFIGISILGSCLNAMQFNTSRCLIH